MDSYSYECGDIAFFNEKRYRIIYLDSLEVVLCLLDTTELVITSIPFINFDEMVKTETCEIIPKEKDLRIADEYVKTLSENAQKTYELRKEIARRIDKEYGPTYKNLGKRSKKPLIEELVQSGVIEIKALRLLIRKYLQGGLSDFSLLNQERSSREKHYRTKPGPLGTLNVKGTYIVTAASEEAFNYGLDIFKSGREQTFISAYNSMKKKYFYHTVVEDGKAKSKPLPAVECPSYKQFYRWCKKRLTPEEYETLKTSAMEYRNNRRKKTGDSSWHVERPGEGVQVDACEVDLSLVSIVNFGQTVSRCVVYGMRDMLTHAIVAVSASFENNSTLGWSNLMLNLCEDKGDLCARYGISVPNIDKIWPSHFLPSFIINDCGPEFRSHKVEKILDELSVTRRNAPPGTGSMKGLIEQMFHQINVKMKPYTEGAGMISKRYDSRHHEEACLTITDFTKMLYLFVISYNQKHMDDYKREAYMVEGDVDATPALLWEYCCSKKGSPRPIRNKLEYMYKFLDMKKATLSNNCITLKTLGLRYYNPQDVELTIRMADLGSKKEEMYVYVDPRDVSRVYYINKKGEMKSAELITRNIKWMDSLKTRTFKEAEDYIKNNKISNAKAKERNEEIDADLAGLYKDIVEEAKERQGKVKPKTDNIRDAQKEEKNLINSMQSLTRRIEKEKNGGIENDIPEITQAVTEVVEEQTEDEKKYLSDEELEERFKKEMEDLY